MPSTTWLILTLEFKSESRTCNSIVWMTGGADGGGGGRAGSAGGWGWGDGGAHAQPMEMSASIGQAKAGSFVTLKNKSSSPAASCISRRISESVLRMRVAGPLRKARVRPSRSTEAATRRPGTHTRGATVSKKRLSDSGATERSKPSHGAAGGYGGSGGGDGADGGGATRRQEPSSTMASGRKLTAIGSLHPGVGASWDHARAVIVVCPGPIVDRARKSASFRPWHARASICGAGLVIEHSRICAPGVDAASVVQVGGEAEVGGSCVSAAAEREARTISVGSEGIKIGQAAIGASADKAAAIVYGGIVQKVQGTGICAAGRRRWGR
eukprot:scaffold3136_cov123-Isochrysis_galbana.AAC.1